MVNRTEVSQKASEVHALTDQLSEEHKKSRELQWTTEKERCRTGRKEDSEREQLEVRTLFSVSVWSFELFCSRTQLIDLGGQSKFK